MTDLLSALPAELGLRIALNLPLPSLAAFEQVSRAWRALVLEHEDLVFARAAGHDYTAEGQGAAAGLEHASEVEKKRVFRTAAWEAIGSWREFCRRRSLASEGSHEPLCYRARKLTTAGAVGGLSMVWRLKVDLANRWLLTTDHRGGLTVTDLDTNETLWRISPSNLRPFAHLEYDPGPEATMVVDRFSDELEVWKLDQSGLRGHFKLVGLVPALANMRGYHLKQGTLAIVTATGETAYHDLSGEAPVHLRTLSHAAGPIGYLDKTPETLVLCHGSSVRCYDPVSAVERGSFPPPAGTPLMHYHVRRPAAIVPPARLAEVEVTETGIRPFVENPLDPAVFDGDGGEWQACHVNGPYLVALSKKSRLFVCTDYEAVLAADDPAERSRVIERSCSVFDIDRLPNGEDEDADGTNWLSVLDGRAAFGASDHLLLLSLPRPKLNSYAPSRPIPRALGYPMDPDVPPSCIQLVADGVFFTVRDFMRKVVVAVWNEGAPLQAVDLDIAGEDAETEDDWEDTDLDD